MKITDKLKITDKYRIDTISIPKNKWIGLKERVERIGKGRDFRSIVAGIIIGIFLMATFGMYYVDPKEKDIVIIGKNDVHLVFMALFFGAIFGLITIFAYYIYQLDLDETRTGILNEMKEFEKKRASQEETTSR
jgi:hypothetical protein